MYKKISHVTEFPVYVALNPKNPWRDKVKVNNIIITTQKIKVLSMDHLAVFLPIEKYLLIEPVPKLVEIVEEVDVRIIPEIVIEDNVEKELKQEIKEDAKEVKKDLKEYTKLDKPKKTRSKKVTI